MLEKKIALLTSVTFNNIGNGFIDLGAEAALMKALPLNAELFKVSSNANFAATMGQMFMLKENPIINWLWVHTMGYISPKYAFYLKDNTIPEHAFSKSYANALTSFTLEKKGEQVFMVKTTMYPPQGESIPMSSVESYAGKIEGNALVFTYFSGMPTQDINEMSKVEPYVVYYWKESGMFIMEGENYAADM